MTWQLDLHWIYNPLTFYAGLALTLAAFLLFFVSVKREMHRMECRAGDTNQNARQEFAALSNEMNAMKHDLREIERRPASPAPGRSLNLTRRAQALRMHLRGEAAPTIAAALQTPRNEIDLLLKVRRIQSEGPGKLADVSKDTVTDGNLITDPANRG